MKRNILILLCLIYLQGCALPLPIQVASWVLDGASLVLTEKSITDHGISLLVQKDCAIWRGLTGDNFCIDDTNTTNAVAVASNGPQTPSRGLRGITEEPHVKALADFETASGQPPGEAPLAVPELLESAYIVALIDSDPSTVNAEWRTLRPVNVVPAIAGLASVAAAPVSPSTLGMPNLLEAVYSASFAASGQTATTPGWFPSGAGYMASRPATLESAEVDAPARETSQAVPPMHLAATATHTAFD